ncbi:hypothetical protein D9M71_494420 [compost metagenome]
MGDFLPQLGCFLPSQRRADGGISAQTQPAPFPSLILVAQLPGLLAFRFHPQVEAIAVVLAVLPRLRLQASYSRIAERPALDL